jgi:prepilin-type N-terminal cleavage/methylation domain-containing protein
VSHVANIFKIGIILRYNFLKIPGKKMGQNGFTLIEVLIGLVILAIGILGAASMQIASVKGDVFSSSLTQAAILAQDKLEYLKDLSYGDSNLNSGQYNEGPIPGTIFSRHYNIVEDVGNSIKTITVTVQWATRVNHNLTLKTIRAK